ncbi:MAG: UbiA family prenyltransferase [Candidatus Methanoplasma sp.]|jgi:geranylgeranylglycerol-phosphate geranylgeranyltransferase|nr:UbiA family prenyltransferase [Candidatus Methanoplasma sp.]
MREYLRLFRLGNGIIGILGVIIGAFMAVGLDIGDYITEIIVGCLIVIAFIAGGNSLNDYIDRDIDKIGHPERPLPMGEISPTTALYLGISGLILAALLSLLLVSLLVTSVIIVAAILMVSYELFLKQRGFVGNLTIAVLTGLVFLFGGSLVGNIEGNLVIAAMAALVNVGREIAKDIEDISSDEGRKTLPMKIGIRNACVVGAVFFISGPILSIWPLIDHTFGWLYCLVFVADTIFIYTAFLIFGKAHKAQKLAKPAMLIALVAFVLGVI